MKFEQMHKLLCEKDTQVKRYERALLETALFYQFADDNVLTEGLLDDIKNKAKFTWDMAKLATTASIKDIISSYGFSAHKGEGGLFQMLKAAGKQMLAVMIASFRAMRGGAKEKAELKQVIKDSKINPKQLIHFLLQLDTATMHLVSGPLHMIDAVTGWHIWADIQHKAKETCNHAMDAYKSLTSLLGTLSGKAEKKLQGFIDKIMSFFKSDTSCEVPTGASAH